MNKNPYRFSALRNRWRALDCHKKSLRRLRANIKKQRDAFLALKSIDDLTKRELLRPTMDMETYIQLTFLWWRFISKAALVVCLVPIMGGGIGLSIVVVRHLFQLDYSTTPGAHVRGPVAIYITVLVSLLLVIAPFYVRMFFSPRTRAF